jgi:hypothetical protein
MTDMSERLLPVTWTIGYRKQDGLLAYGRTSNPEIATSCEEKGMTAVTGGLYLDANVRADILAARKEVDVNFDGGWHGDCTRGCECDQPTNQCGGM